MDKKIICYHCGQTCDDLITYRELNFCCRGCLTVFRFLQKNRLHAYYRMESHPGIKPEEGEDYRFLDHPEIIAKRVTIQGEQARVSLKLPAIHCASCVWLLENLDRIQTGVYSVRVDFLKRRAQITFHSEKITLRKLVELLASLGYPPEISGDDTDQSESSAVSARLLTQIAVAGFCFGNIMLISLPEYFGLDWIAEYSFVRFFGYLNILLSLPILWFSGRDYFISAWAGWRWRRINIDVPIALGMTVLFLRSTYEVVSATGGGYFDSLAGLVFFLLLGRAFQEYTYHRISFDRDYRSYFPIAVSRWQDGKEEVVPVEKIVPGDIVMIYSRQVLPVDGELLSSQAEFDFSFITGESKLIAKKNGEPLPAGGRNCGERIKVKVVKEFSQSSFLEMWNQEVFQESEKSTPYSPIPQSLINRISKAFTLIVMTIAFSGAAYWTYQGYIGSGDFGRAIEVFTAVLIVACPCALALSSPITLGMGLRALSQHGLFIKNSETLERLAGINTMVFDKTGTLTRHTVGKEVNSVHYRGKTLSSTEKKSLAQLAQHSTHPLSRLLHLHFLKINPTETKEIKVNDFEEIIGKGMMGKMNGLKIRYGSEKFIKGKFDEDKKSSQTSLTSQVSQVHIEIDGKYYGVFEMVQNFRDNWKEVLSDLKNNYRLALLSGDNPDEAKILQPFFDDEQVKFQQSPLDKLNWVRHAQEQGRKVLMMGDGLNDAGALKQSDVGVALSEEVRGFSPACDAILDGENFSQLPRMLSFARKCRAVIIISFLISFAYNFVGLYFSVQGELTPVMAAILMPVSSVTVVGAILMMVSLIKIGSGLKTS